MKKEDIIMMFPNYKPKAFTMSYDDGVEQDIPLIAIMNKNGLKGTFNLNSGLFTEEGTVFEEGRIHRIMTLKQAIQTYKSDSIEVAIHSLTHPRLEQLSKEEIIKEVKEDKANLSNIFQYDVRGMAYPVGTYNDLVIEVLKELNIAYSRTVKETKDFLIPTNWLELEATCHHNNPMLMELAHKFVESTSLQPQLFYLWGHSYEFESDNNWNVIEEFCEFIGNRKEIWYATNIEIYDYVQCFESLEIVDNKIINHSNKEVFFIVNDEKHSIKGQQTLVL